MFARALTPAPALAGVLLSALALSGCMTPHVEPAPSQAILQARAHTDQTATCKPGGLEAISPIDASFPFDDAQISEAGQQRLTAAAHWLVCNPGVAVVIRPDADNHGDAAHMSDLAGRRAHAVADDLRHLGATAPVIHMLARGAADPVTEPHLVINATGRGW